MKWMPFRSPPTAHVAPLTSADRAGELAALHATAFARPWEADEFERMLCERGHIAHALMLGTVIGGFVLSRQVLDEAEILTIVLGPASRGAGLSRQLLRAHLVALEDAGVRRVHLEVDDGNAAALALYHRHRFAETGRRASYYARPDGSRANAIMMQAALG